MIWMGFQNQLGRGHAKNSACRRPAWTGWAGTSPHPLPAPLVGLPWAPVPPPSPSPPPALSSHYRGSRLHPPSSSPGNRHSWGPPHLPHQHGAQLGVPRATIPKTQRGAEAKESSDP